MTVCDLELSFSLLTTFKIYISHVRFSVRLQTYSMSIISTVRDLERFSNSDGWSDLQGHSRSLMLALWNRPHIIVPLSLCLWWNYIDKTFCCHGPSRATSATTECLVCLSDWSMTRPTIAKLHRFLNWAVCVTGHCPSSRNCASMSIKKLWNTFVLWWITCRLPAAYYYDNILCVILEPCALAKTRFKTFNFFVYYFMLKIIHQINPFSK